MFVSENTLLAIKAYYINELNQLYDSSEIEQLLYITASHYFGWDKVTYRLNATTKLSESELLNFHWVLKRLKNSEPIQHILGEAHFYDLIFEVNEHVLIPRQETEELVDLILENLKEDDTILDIGTGSGIIPITIQSNCKACKTIGIDVSEDALTVAKSNALKNKATVEFIQMDILCCDSLIEFNPTIIVSNPPYITQKEKNEMHENVLNFEPHLALFVEDDQPLIFYQKIAELAWEALPNKGQLFFEINEHFGVETKNLLKSIGFSDIRLIKDLNKKDRMIHAVR